MTRQLRMMVTMVLLFLALSGAGLARAYAAEQGAAPTQRGSAELHGESGVDAGTEALPLSAGVSEQALSFSRSSGPVLVVLGCFIGWLSRRRVARRGAWCR